LISFAEFHFQRFRFLLTLFWTRVLIR